MQGISIALRKIFGGLRLTWPRLVLAAVLSAAVTAAAALIPVLRNTSFISITVTYEIWILFGIVIIMNSRSNLDSAFKCLVFFLISQPLIYLFQVPFSPLGWALIGYYRYWFAVTLLCFPMGYVGYWMKKGKWWGYLILLPMIALTAYSYLLYFSEFQFSMPRYILIVLFCAFAIILYPAGIFESKGIRVFGMAFGAAAVAVLTAVCILNPPVLSTEIAANGEEIVFDGSYSVSLADGSFGDVEIRYVSSLEDHVLHGDLRKAGDTVLTLISPDGEKTEYDIHIERSSVEISRKSRE